MGDDKELLRSNTQKNIEIKMNAEADQMKTERNSLPGPDQLKKSESKKTAKIKEPDKVVPGNQIKQLPKLGEVRPMSGEDRAALKKIYNDKDKDIHMAALMKLLNKEMKDAPKERNDLVFIRGEFMQKVTGGEGFIWAPGTNPLIIQHIDWLMEYFKVNDDSIAEFKEEDKEQVIPELPVNEYDVSVKGLENIYEYQGKTLNCYCCAGSAMLNQFLSLQNNAPNQVQYYNQQQVRNFRPRIKKHQPAFDFFADRSDYDDHVKELDNYAGKGKHAVGNVFEIGDFFIDKLGEHNAMLNKMVFIVPQADSANEEKDNIKYHNMTTVFKDKVAEVLSTGNVVNFLTTSGDSGHYTTITGLKGDMVEYLDSNLEHQYNVVQTTTVEELFKRIEGRSNQLEIEFISQMKAPDEMKQEFSDLEYSDEHGYSLKKLSDENVINVGQTKGLAVKKNFKDQGPGMDDIYHVVYFDNPKRQQVETETIDEHVWVNKKYTGDAAGADAEPKTKTKTKAKTKEETVIDTKTTTKSGDEAGADAVPEKKVVSRQTVATPEATSIYTEKTDGSKELTIKGNTETTAQANAVEATRVTARQTVKKSIRPNQEMTEEELERLEEYQYDQMLKKKDRAHRERVEGKVRKVKNYLDKEKVKGMSTRQLKNSKIDKIKQHEKKNADYQSFGVAFDLRNVDINIADSKYMRRVKVFLEDYLKKRKAIFEKRDLKEQTARALMDMEDGHKNGGILISNDGLSYGAISDTEREVLGNAHEQLWAAVDKYLQERDSIFQTKRRKARVEQVKSLKKQLMLDDYRFKLTKVKRDLNKSVDNKYSYEKIEGWKDTRKALMPTFQHIAQLDDFIDMNNMRLNERRERQKALGSLPGVGTRMKQYLGVFGLNTLARLGMVYNFAGGLVDRTLGAATMLAANGLELAGKVVKLPFKIASAIFNFGSKYIARSDVRWRVDYSLTKGWKNLDEGRKIFRRYLKGACILPAAVVETVTRGIPYLFGHYFKSPVYKCTRRWSADIANDIGNVFGSLTSKKYSYTKKGYEDVIMAGKEVDKNMIKKYKIKPESLYDETGSEIEEEEKKEDVSSYLQDSDKLEAEYDSIDKLYEGSKISKKDLEQVKDMAKAKAILKSKTNGTLPEDMMKELHSQKFIKMPGIDGRGFATLLRPVKVDEYGEPLTKEDEKNRELNVADFNGYKTKKMSDRTNHLDYIATAIIKDMYTTKQLNDPDFIRKDKERALRLLNRLMHFDKCMSDYTDYFYTKADPKIRVFCFLLRSSYNGYITQKLQAALFGYGYGSFDVYEGKKSCDMIPYVQGTDIKKLKAENERISNLPGIHATMIMTTYSNLHAQGKDYFSKASQNQIKNCVPEEANMEIESALNSTKKIFFRESGVKFTKGFVPIKTLIDTSKEKMDEFLKRQDDKAYLDSMLKKYVDKFAKEYPKEIKNATGITDDLKAVK